MMADPFEIARQSTLLEVQQTGTEVQQTVNKTDATIGDIGDPAGEESLVGLIKNIPETVPTGAVKSVQRGVATLNVNQTTTIKISSINPAKSFVLLNGGVEKEFGRFFLESLSSTELKIRYDNYASVTAKCSWQVIECF